MPKNQEIINALKDQNLFTYKGHIEALDALVKADTDPVAFKKALINHKAFWLKFEGLSDEAFDGEFLDLTDENFVINISHKAQTRLLLNQIRKETDIKKIDTLLTAIADENNEFDNKAFQKAAVSLGVSSEAAQRMTGYDEDEWCVGNEIQHEVAKISLLHSKHFNENYIAINKGSDIKNVLNQQNYETFVEAFPPPYKFCLSPDNEVDMDEIKGKLGEEYLKRQISSYSTDNLLEIINADGIGTLRLKFKTLEDIAGDKAFTDLAVTEANIAGLRNLAALQILDRNIRQSYNLKALKALSKIAAADPQRKDEFKKILKENREFGLDDAAIAAFVFDNNDRLVLKTAVAASHIRLNMLNATPEQLQNIIKKEDSAKALKVLFEETFRDMTKFNYLNHYFEGKPENRLRVRQQALMGLARVAYSDLNGKELHAIIIHITGDDLRTSLQKITNNQFEIQDLIDNDINSETNQMLLAYAQAEKLVKSAAKDYDTLVAWVNGKFDKEYYDLIDKLPLAEQHRLQSQLANIMLANCPPEKAGLLIALTQATTLEEIKEALKNLDVTHLIWVNADNMGLLQNAAHSRAIELAIDRESTIGAGTHPQLVKFLSNPKYFSSEDRKNLLAKPELLRALINAGDTAKEVSSKLSTMLGVSEAQIINNTLLIKEYERIALIKKVHNVAIVEVLALYPSMSLDTGKIKQINDILLHLQDESLAEENYPAIVETLKKIVAPQDGKLFYKAFGLNANGDIEADGIRKSIEEQDDYNKDLAKYYINIEPNDVYKKNVIDFLLKLKKNDTFPEDQIDPVLDAFATAKTRDDLLARIKAVAVPQVGNRTIEAETINSFEINLTHSTYRYLKNGFSQSQYLTLGSHRALIDADKAVLKKQFKVFEELNKMDTPVRKELKRLSELKSLNWLNPAFQAASKQHAHEMKPHFEKLAVDSSLIVKQLSLQLAVIKDMLASLPDQTALEDNPVHKKQKKEIEDHRKELEIKQLNLDNLLNPYINLNRILYGNPNEEEDEFLQKGVLKILEEANKGRQVTFLGFNSTCRKYNIKEKEEHLQAAYKDGVKVKSETQVRLDRENNSMYAVEHFRLEKEEFLEYTIGSGEDEGYFIEEHGETHFAPQYQEGKVHFKPSVILTASKFPANGSEKAKITYAMAMASQLLAGCDKNSAPSAKNRILITGDPKEMEYIWTAFMILGENKDMPFGAESINVVGTDFNKQLGTFWGFSDNSLYNRKMANKKSEVGKDIKSFKERVVELKLDRGLRDLKSDQNQMLSNSSAQTKVYEDAIKSSSRLFKGEFDIIKKTIESKNLEQETLDESGLKRNKH